MYFVIFTVRVPGVKKKTDFSISISQPNSFNSRQYHAGLNSVGFSSLTVGSRCFECKPNLNLRCVSSAGSSSHADAKCQYTDAASSSAVCLCLWLPHLFVQQRGAHQLIIWLHRVFPIKKMPGMMPLISCLCTVCSHKKDDCSISPPPSIPSL